MNSISKVQLPSGNTYEIKDAVARQAIAGGISFIIAWDGTSVPVPSNIPAGVVATYEGISYTGTLAATAAQAGAFYLVKSSTQTELLDKFDEYVPVTQGTSKIWEKLGDTTIDLSILGQLAYKDNVSIQKGNGEYVLGEDTFFTNASSAVTFTGRQTKEALGVDTTFKTEVEFSEESVDVPVVSENAQRSIPNVTSVGEASSWGFAMGSGDSAETLIISGSNGTAPSLGAPIQATDTQFGTPVQASVVSGATATTEVETPDTVEAVTEVGTGQAAAQTITVGTNDKVQVAKYSDLGVSVS